ncbi:MAG: helix-hairpin-helix domain-containing protein [Saprospiraceae bacterium]|nr:helix-hairpin-helix domain-containing protein [Saprospiraceae bacterium]
MKNRLSREDRSGLFFLAMLSLCFIGSRMITGKSQPKSVELGFAEAFMPQSNFEAEPPTDSGYGKAFFAFDPNSCPADSLHLLPLPQKVIQNLIKYREKGGSFRKKEDLAKIYGMGDYWKEISSYVNIAQETDVPQNIKSTTFQEEGPYNHQKSMETDAPSVNPISTAKLPDISLARAIDKSNIMPDTSFAAAKSLEAAANQDKNAPTKKDKIEEKPTKDNVDHLVEINSASQYELMAVKGIGPYYSKLIVAYRERIGGFIDKDQILGISGIRSDRAMEWLDQLYADKSLVRKLDLNAASFKQLAAFPDIGYKKAEIVKLYQKNNGDFKSVASLASVGIFSKDEISFLENYLFVR